LALRDHSNRGKPILLKQSATIERITQLGHGFDSTGGLTRVTIDAGKDLMLCA
jgi:hypothetical protein